MSSDIQDTAKSLFRDLWSNKPLFLTVIAAALIVGYMLYKKTGGAALVAPGGSTDNLGLTGNTFNNTYNTTSTTTTNPTQVIQGQPVASVPVPVSHAIGSTFLGPTGVKHYVSTGSQTLSQIASSFGLASWNSIYAIPDNQKLFGKLSANQAKTYKPHANQVITLPPQTRKGF